jgi:arginyl-tRNA synthetase
VSKFASDGKSLFGGQWDIYVINESNPSIEIDYKSKDITDVDIIEDLDVLKKKNIKGTKGLTKRKAESLGLVNTDSYLMVLNKVIVDVLIKNNPELAGEKILDFCSNKKFGDFSSNVAFRIAPLLKKSPYDTGLVLKENLLEDERVNKYFSNIDVARNGFMNFFVDDGAILEVLSTALSDFTSFSSFDLVGGKSILIESPSANPNKPLHVGHLLNVFLGKSLMEIFSRVGFTVYNDNIINDRGMPICKAIWALKKYGMDSSPEKENMKPDHFVGKYYVLGSNEFKESKEVETEVREILKKWEAGDEEIVSIGRN